MAGTMLPNTTLVAGYAVGAVVNVLAMYTAHGAVKIPIVHFLLLELLNILLFLLKKGLACTFRRTCVAALNALAAAFQLGKFFFVKDTSHLPIFDTLLTGHHAGFTVLDKG